MRIRAVHLASVLLLLASLGVAEGPVLRDGGCGIGGHYISILLGQEMAADNAHAALNTREANHLARTLPVAALAQYRTAWAMRPPSSYSALMHAVTGLAA